MMIPGWLTKGLKYLGIFILLLLVVQIIGALELLTDPSAATAEISKFDKQFQTAIGKGGLSSVLNMIRPIAPILFPGLIVFFIVWGILSQLHAFSEEPRVRAGLSLAIGALVGLYTPAAAVIIYLILESTIYFALLIAIWTAYYGLEYMAHKGEMFGVGMKQTKYEKLGESELTREHAEAFKEELKAEAESKKAEAADVRMENLIGKRASQEIRDVLNECDKALGVMLKSARGGLEINVSGLLMTAKSRLTQLQTDITGYEDKFKDVTRDYMSHMHAVGDMVNTTVRSSDAANIEKNVNRVVKELEVHGGFLGKDAVRKGIDDHVSLLKRMKRYSGQLEKVSENLTKLKHAITAQKSKIDSALTQEQVRNDPSLKARMDTLRLRYEGQSKAIEDSGLEADINALRANIQKLMEIDLDQTRIMEHFMGELPNFLAAQLKGEIAAVRGGGRRGEDVANEYKSQGVSKAQTLAASLNPNLKHYQLDMGAGGVLTLRDMAGTDLVHENIFY